MLQAKTRWILRQTDIHKAKQIANELQIAPLVAQILVNRGINTVEAARSFLFSEEDFHDPFLLPDMQVSVERIMDAISKGEQIIIYGDYDADGICSTVVLFKALQELGANVRYYIPNRLIEGYGPNENAFRRFKEEGVDLIITVDNGIAAVHEAEVAKECGIDLIITDHHEVKDQLPSALGIIHPKRKDSQYPFKELAGVGVSFKLASALLRKTPVDLIPYVAIGTIADLVPLNGENRLLVKKGISLLKETNDLGLRALIKQASINQQEINEDSIGFALAPRINAPGRLGSATVVVELFTTSDWETAEKLAKQLDLQNQERQEIVNQIAEEAILQVTEYHDDKVIVVGNKDWHPGVIGIVASRLVEKFYKPVIVFSYDFATNVAKGSARSIPNFNIYENLAKCQHILPHFGGHPMAAGMTLKIEDVDELRKRLNEFAETQLTDEDFVPVTEFDSIISLEEITIETIEQLELLAPFGMNNPKPKILIQDIRLPNIRKVGSHENHLKVTLQNQSHTLDGIAFDMGNYADHISPLANASVIGELGINEWNNLRKPQIYLKDIAINEWQLFDYRGNKKFEQWLHKVPKQKRKLIVFQEQSLKFFQNTPFANEITIIDSDQQGKDISLAGTNLVLLDLPPTKQRLLSLIQGKTVERIYAHFYQEKDHFFTTFPTRDHFKWFYAFLLKNGVFDIQRYGQDLAKYRGWTNQTIHFMTKVFLELDFITMNKGIVSVNKSARKRDLLESSTYQKMQENVQLEKDLLYSSYDQLKKWFDQYLNTSDVEEEKLYGFKRLYCHCS